jgi:hypothetical protein
MLNRPRTLFIAFSLLLLIPMAAPAQDQRGEGPIDPSQPTGVTVDQIIQKFAAREKEFKDARENYIIRQTVKVQTLDGDTVDGEFQQVMDVTFDDKGKREEKVLFAPQPTLTRIMMTREDFDDIQHQYPFVLTIDELPDYQILYVGKQRIDEVTTYVFDIAPKEMKKGRRFFQGRIWVDDRDFQIVKTYGKAVGYFSNNKKENENNLFPNFVTYREQVDGKYWFPTYTHADEVLHFRDGDVHIRITVRYQDYQRFGTSVQIKYNDKQLEKPQDQKPDQPQQQPPK